MADLEAAGLGAVVDALAESEPGLRHEVLDVLSGAVEPTEGVLAWLKACEPGMFAPGPCVVAAEPSRERQLRGAREARSALEALVRGLGFGPASPGADRGDGGVDATLDAIFGAVAERAERGEAGDEVLGLDPWRAAETLRLRDEIQAELGVRQPVPIRVGALDGGLLGQSMPGVIWLGSGFEPTSRMGRAVLAHELVHEAQRGLPGPGDLWGAEREAETIMTSVYGGGAAFAPSVALPPGVYAGCGPRAMAEETAREEEAEEERGTQTPVPRAPKKEVPDNDVEGTLVSWDERREQPEMVAVETHTPKHEVAGAEGNTGDCKEPCPEPLPEHVNDLPVRAPTAEAPKGEGEVRTLNLAGHVIKFRLPKDAHAGQVRVTFRNADQPYGAMTLKSAVLTIDDALQVKSGQLYAEVRLGKFIHVPNAMLTITHRGQVAAKIKDARVAIGSVVKGKVDLDIGPEGVWGQGVFSAKEIALGSKMKVTDGRLHVKVSRGGAVTAHGLIGIEVIGLGKVELEACFVDGEVAGRVTVTLKKAIPFGLGRITRVELSGCYKKTGWSLHGEVDLEVRDWLKGTVKADLTRDAQGGLAWVVEGEVKQAKNLELGGLTVFGGKVSAKWNKTKWEPARAELKYHSKHVEGELTGTYDIEKGKASGDGVARVAEPLPVGPFSLDEGELRARIEDNELTEIVGTCKVSMAYKGAPAFEVSCDRAVYDVKKGDFHANGSMQVLREITLGTKAGLHLSVPVGPAGSFAVEYGMLRRLDAGVAVEVAHGGDAIGRGQVGFDYSESGGFNGAVTFSLVGRAGIPRHAEGPVFLLPGGSFEATLVNSELGVAAARDVQWELVNPQGAGRVCGQVAGSWDFGPRSGRLTGQAWVHEEWESQVGPLSLTFEQGGEGNVAMGEAGVEKLDGKLGFRAEVAAGALGTVAVKGHFAGALDPEAGTASGEFSAALAEGSELRFPEMGGYQLVGKGGTTLSGRFERSALAGPVGVELVLGVLKAGAALFEGRLEGGTVDLDTGMVNGAATLSLAVERSLEELGVSLPAGVVGRFLPGCGLTTTITNNEPSAVAGKVLAMFDQAGQAMAQAELDIDWDLVGGKFGARGTASLLGDLNVREGGESVAMSGWGLTLLGGSEVGVEIVDNALVEAQVGLMLGAERGGERVATATLGGQWVLGEVEALSGIANVTLVRDVVLGGGGRFEVAIASGSTVEAAVEASAFSSGHGTIALMLREAGADMARLTLEADVAESVSGQASLQVLKNIRLGQRRVGGVGYAVELSTETGGVVVVEDNTPTRMDGTLTIEVLGDEAPFAKASVTMSADLQRADAGVDADGTFEVFRPLPLGEASDFALSLEPPTRCEGTVRQSGLEQMSGALSVGIERDGGRVGKVEIGGTYVGGQTPRLDGSATVTIEEGFPLYAAGPYELGFAPSTFVAVLANGDITSVRGRFGLHAEQRGSDDEAPLGTLTLDFDGSYARAPGAAQGTVTGQGRVAVEGEFRVAQAGEFSLHMTSASAVVARFAGNTITHVDGEIGGRVDQASPRSGETSQFLGVSGEVHYRPEDGGKIDARATATMLGRRRIVESEGYGFWLAPGLGETSATIVIEGNEVRSLSGRIGAEVHDGEGLLFGLTVSGAWDAGSGKVDGEGMVRLGRALTFPKGASSGPRLVVEAGATGQARVVASELESLQAAASVTVYDQRGPVVGIDGEARFEAIHGKLEEASGGVRLLRPIEIGGAGDAALVRITAMTAQAHVVDGALDEASGELRVELPRLGRGFVGTLSGGWAAGKDGAEDQYWGTGTIDMPILDDAESGRRVHGKLGVTVAKDGAWTTSGTLDFQLMEGVGGEVTVEMDQRLEPVIGMSFDAAMTLMEARTLFEKKFNLVPRIAMGGFPVGFAFGVSAGIGVKTRALRGAAHVEAQGWRPLGAKKEKLPKIDAAIALQGGLDLNAMVAAFLEVTLGFGPILSLNAGIRTGLELNVPVVLAPRATLRTEGDQLAGALEMSVKIAPTLALKVTPYIGGEVVGFDVGPHEFKPWEQDLGSPFSFEWGTRYAFGDKTGQTPIAAGATTATSGTATHRKEEHQVAPRFPDVEGTTPAAKKGMPEVEGVPGKREEKTGGAGQGELGKLMTVLTELGKVAEAVKSYMDTAPLTPRDEVKRRWEAVGATGRGLFAACEGAFGALKTSIPMWVRLIIDAKPGETPTLFEAWNREDDVSREIVRRGDHTTMTMDERVQITEAMLRGSCGDEDEAMVLAVLEDAKKRGDIQGLVARVGAGRLDSKVDGEEHDRLVALLDAAGIR